MEINWIDTDNGPWPEGIIDPAVLREWYAEDQLSGFRQAVFMSIIQLIRMIRELEREA